MGAVKSRNIQTLLPEARGKQPSSGGWQGPRDPQHASHVRTASQGAPRGWLAHFLEHRRPKPGALMAID